MTPPGLEPATFRFVAQYLNHCAIYKCKGKAVPLQAWSGPEDSRKFRFPDYMTMAQDGVKVRSLGTGQLYPQEMLLLIISVRG
jgi:hypothetical protein